MSRGKESQNESQKLVAELTRKTNVKKSSRKSRRNESQKRVKEKSQRKESKKVWQK